MKVCLMSHHRVTMLRDIFGFSLRCIDFVSFTDAVSSFSFSFFLYPFFSVPSLTFPILFFFLSFFFASMRCCTILCSY
jgi:hypothetical protein